MEHTQVVSQPEAFDPVAYVADIRATGVEIIARPERRDYVLHAPHGFGEDFDAVILKWAETMALDEHHASRTCQVLTDGSGDTPCA